MTLFQFAQMVSIEPKFEWSCFNYPIRTVGICTIVFNSMQISKKCFYITRIKK